MSPRTPLVDPSAYFRREDRPAMGLALGIVTANAVLLPVLLWWFVDNLLGQLDASAAARNEAMSQISGQLVGLFFLTYVGWLLIAGIIHLFMWFANADRGYGTTLAVVGESMLVSLVLLPVFAVVFSLLIDRIPADPEAAVAFFQRVAGNGTSLLMLVSFVRMLWEAVVQAVGLAEEHDVSLGKTALVTIVLGLVGLLFG